MGKSSPFGVRGPRGTLEKDVTLEVARRLSTMIPRWIDCRLTRDADRNVPIAARASTARSLGADVFVSIHANDGPAGSHGSQVWVHERARPAATELAHAIAHELGTPSGVQHGSLALLDPSALSTAAACLVEVEYLSEPSGEAILRDPRTLDELARKLAHAIETYLSTSGAHARHRRTHHNERVPLAYDATYGAALPRALTAAAIAPEPRVDGIDIYGGNDEPNWGAFKRAGFRFAFHKTSQQFARTTSIDTSFKDGGRRDRTRSNGIVCGSFHFYGHSAHADGAQQADVVAAQVERLLPGDLAPSLDFELGASVAGMDGPGWLRELSGFLDRVERRLGRTPIVYTREHVWANVVESTPRFDPAAFAYFEIYPLWTIHEFDRTEVVDGEAVPISADILQEHEKHHDAHIAKYRRAAAMLGNDRFDARATTNPTLHPPHGHMPDIPVPWQRLGRWAFLQYSDLTPGRFLAGGAQPLGMDRLTDFDVTRGGLHFLEGLADMGRLGVALTTSGVSVVHRELNGRTYVSLRPSTASGWTARDLTAANLVGAEAKDVVLGAQGGQVFAYWRQGNSLREAAAASGFAGATDLRALFDPQDLSFDPIHDPRLAGDATTRYVVFWGFDDDWHVVRYDVGTRQRTPIPNLLRAALGNRAPSATGQPVAYLGGDARLRVVGRAGSDGRLFEVAWNGSAWTATDLFDGARWIDVDEAKRAATYSPTVLAVDGETFVVFRTVRGDLCALARSRREIRSLTSSAPFAAVGHPTSFVTDAAHVVFRGLDGNLYDVNNLAGGGRVAKIDCGDVELVADPVAASSGQVAVVAARAIDGAVHLARFLSGAWTCEVAHRP
jgi:GH25 family lysozyme M1 (1,4-beta-N-acetylmuramidase)